MKLQSFILVGGFVFTLIAAQISSGVTVQPSGILLRENFQDGLPERWKPVQLGNGKGTGSARVFSGPNGNHFVQVSTTDAFYGVGVYEKFDPASYPEVSWRWRVVRFPSDANIKVKSGDDAAARLYVIFNDRSLLHPFGTTALVYVWDTRYPAGSIIPNPYEPGREKAIVLESGKARLRQWTREQVNIEADYRRTFGQAPGSVKGIVFASDSDNTDSASVSDFTELTVSMPVRSQNAAPAR